MVAAHCVAAKNIFLQTIHRCCFSAFGSRKVLIAAHPPTLTRSHTRLQTSHRIPSSAPTTHTMARKTRTPTTHFTGTTVARPDRTTVRYFCRLLGTDHLAMLCNVLDRADFDANVFEYVSACFVSLFRNYTLLPCSPTNDPSHQVRVGRKGWLRRLRRAVLVCWVGDQ